MTDQAPLPETVRLIARILGARQTKQEEVPELIETVQRAVEALNAPAEIPVAALQPSVAPSAAAQTTRERRPRGHRAREVFAPVSAPTPVASAPKLMRREDVGPAPAASILEMRPASKTRTGLRGVVKWFDPKTRVGALRLPGYDDVAVDADALERASVPRLFKGQEIEASIVIEPNAPARLLALSLPGRPETEGIGPLGAPRRHQKQVVIEMKRDALKRVGARLEAEQLLGGGRR